MILKENNENKTKICQLSLGFIPVNIDIPLAKNTTTTY